MDCAHPQVAVCCRKTIPVASSSSPLHLLLSSSTVCMHCYGTLCPGRCAQHLLMALSRAALSLSVVRRREKAELAPTAKMDSGQRRRRTMALLRDRIHAVGKVFDALKPPPGRWSKVRWAHGRMDMFRGCHGCHGCDIRRWGREEATSLLLPWRSTNGRSAFLPLSLPHLPLAVPALLPQPSTACHRRQTDDTLLDLGLEMFGADFCSLALYVGRDRMTCRQVFHRALRRHRDTVISFVRGA